jgi:hypothetical protein
MATKYFENFPNMYYSNTLCKDLTRRAIVTASNTGSVFEFYPFEISDHLRTDHVAEYYYGDGQLDWLVNIANKNIDPYYGWYQDYETFESSIIEKYGTVEESQQRVMHYINNWADDDILITKSFYENNLTPTLRKYYEPVYGRELNIINYRRKPQDTVQNTNQIWNYTISANNDTIALQLGELVRIKDTGVDATVGWGEVTTANSTIFRIKNVTGDTTANSTVTKDFIGYTSGANVSSANGQNWFYNISNTEFVYYSAVSFYDWETEQNENRKNVNLVGDGIEALMTTEFERIMKSDVDPDTGLSTG